MTATDPVDFPSHAGWSLQGDRAGFESTTIERCPSGWTFFGSTTALENRASWHVSYELVLDSQGVTRSAKVHTRTGAASRSTVLDHDGAGHWDINGLPVAALNGCLDVDLEASALTNAFPARRLIASGSTIEETAPAAYVRVLTTRVERLEQHYRRLQSNGRAGFVFEYQAPAFDFTCQINYDAAGLVVTYPAIATRVPHGLQLEWTEVLR